MHLIELRIANLRNIVDLALDLGPALNVFTGPNGAGKTSILEAAHLLSHGSSFRTPKSDRLIRRDAQTLAVFGEVTDFGVNHRLGLSRTQGRWSAKIDGTPPTNLTNLFSACALVCFEPGSHALISGPASGRRSFLDWAVFHVEPEFAELTRRYRRALRQRNAALKNEAGDDEIASWDIELAQTAEPLAERRAIYLERFNTFLYPLLVTYLPELNASTLNFYPGWNREQNLLTALAAARGRDRIYGYTTQGPHRADWQLGFLQATSHEQLSRGQEKLCAIACILAQAQLYRELRNQWPIIALDDLTSELDAAHQAAVMHTLMQGRAQILLTGTEIPQDLLEWDDTPRKFHVEQGKVRSVV